MKTHSMTLAQLKNSFFNKFTSKTNVYSHYYYYYYYYFSRSSSKKECRPNKLKI